MDDEDRYTRITLRIPRDLHAKLQEASDRTSKSMNAEILARLGDSFRPGDNAEQLKAVLQTAVKLLDHKDAVIDTHQRLIQMMGFYLSELAGRVHDAAPETEALMRFLQDFGDSMSKGKLRDATEHVQDIVEMGEELGILAKGKSGEKAVAGREGERAAFLDALGEIVGSPLDSTTDNPTALTIGKRLTAPPYYQMASRGSREPERSTKTDTLHLNHESQPEDLGPSSAKPARKKKVIE